MPSQQTHVMPIRPKDRLFDETTRINLHHWCKSRAVPHWCRLSFGQSRSGTGGLPSLSSGNSSLALLSPTRDGMPPVAQEFCMCCIVGTVFVLRLENGPSLCRHQSQVSRHLRWRSMKTVAQEPFPLSLQVLIHRVNT